VAAKKGDGLLMVYCEVPAKHEEEFNAWYNEEHIPERLSIPGVLSAARYQAVAGDPSTSPVMSSPPLKRGARRPGRNG
jgi:hypothetical protein